MESTAIVGEKREFIEENEEEEDDEKPTKGEKEGGNVKETFVVKRKRPISSHYKSLNSLLKAMQNMQIVIECKNDVEVSGIVDTVSKNMDIGLNNAKEVFPDGRISESLFLQVNGSAIRYVHLPPKLNTHLLMNNYFKNLESVSEKYHIFNIGEKDEN